MLTFFNLKTQNLDSPYILSEEFQKFIDSSSHDSFSILHLNIRSIKKNFDNFKLFFSTLGFSFSVICFSETWLDEVGNSLYELPNHISKHQVRDDRRGGGVLIYIHNSLSFKVLSNLCINSVDINSLSTELSLDNKRCTFGWVFFSIWVFFHAHSWFTGQQGKGEVIYLTPLYHFHPLRRHLDISQAITAESSNLHIAAGLEPETLGFRAQVANH